MRRLLILVAVTSLVIGAFGSAAGAESIAAVQDDDWPIRLAPPDAAVGADADILVHIEDDTFDEVWGEARAIARGAGGVVSLTSTGVVSENGRRYSHGSFTATVPTTRLDDVIASLGALGTVGTRGNGCRK